MPFIIRNEACKKCGITHKLTREKWHKKRKVERHHYEPYIKNNYLSKLTKVFPFKFLRDEYAPLMRLIMKYLSCEEGFPTSMPITSGCSCTSPR